MHHGLCKERMQMIVVNDFPAFDDAECGACLRRSPSYGLGNAD